jgi:hypothetical protein
MPHNGVNKVTLRTWISRVLSLVLVIGVGVVTFLLAGVPRAEGKKDACPLSAQQERKAVKAFKGLAPVFQEPRCLNCHGAVNPFSRDGGHGGGYIDIRAETKKFLTQPDLQSFLTTGSDPTGTITAKTIAGLKEIAESPSEISDPDFIRQKAFDPMRAACKECHIFSWIIPMRHNHFVGRSTKEMCLHMKTSSLTNRPDLFLRHMQDDELVLEGFKGRKGLLEGGGAEPPAISFATVEKYANDWVDAMGGKFHRPPDCGCTTEGIVLEIYNRIQADPQSAISKIGYAQFDGAVQFEILLGPIAEGWFRGELDVVRPLVVRHVRPAAHACAGSGSRTEHWQVSAQADPKTESMVLHWGFTSSDEQASWTCKGPAGTWTDELLHISLFSNDALHKVQMPAKSGTKKDLNGRDKKFLESLNITVVEGIDEQVK